MNNIQFVNISEDGIDFTLDSLRQLSEKIKSTNSNYLVVTTQNSLKSKKHFQTVLKDLISDKYNLVKKDEINGGILNPSVYVRTRIYRRKDYDIQQNILSSVIKQVSLQSSIGYYQRLLISAPLEVDGNIIDKKYLVINGYFNIDQMLTVPNNGTQIFRKTNILNLLKKIIRVEELERYFSEEYEQVINLYCIDSTNKNFITSLSKEFIKELSMNNNNNNNNNRPLLSRFVKRNNANIYKYNERTAKLIGINRRPEKIIKLSNRSIVLPLFYRTYSHFRVDQITESIKLPLRNLVVSSIIDNISTEDCKFASSIEYKIRCKLKTQFTRRKKTTEDDYFKLFPLKEYIKEYEYPIQLYPGLYSFDIIQDYPFTKLEREYILKLYELQLNNKNRSIRNALPKDNDYKLIFLNSKYEFIEQRYNLNNKIKSSRNIEYALPYIENDIKYTMSLPEFSRIPGIEIPVKTWASEQSLTDFLSELSDEIILQEEMNEKNKNFTELKNKESGKIVNKKLNNLTENNIKHAELPNTYKTYLKMIKDEKLSAKNKLEYLKESKAKKAENDEKRNINQKVLPIPVKTPNEPKPKKSFFGRILGFSSSPPIRQQGGTGIELVILTGVVAIISTIIYQLIMFFFNIISAYNFYLVEKCTGIGSNKNIIEDLITTNYTNFFVSLLLIISDSFISALFCMIPAPIVRQIIFFLIRFLLNSVKYIRNTGVFTSLTIIKTTIYSTFDFKKVCERYNDYIKSQQNTLVQNKSLKIIIKNTLTSVSSNVSSKGKCIFLSKASSIKNTVRNLGLNKSFLKSPDVENQLNNKNTANVYNKAKKIIEVIVDQNIVDTIIKSIPELYAIYNKIIEKNKKTPLMCLGCKDIINYLFFIIIETDTSTYKKNIIGISYCKMDFILSVYLKHYNKISKLNKKQLSKIDDKEINKQIETFFGTEDIPNIMEFKQFVIQYLLAFVKRPFKVIRIL